jgi:transposase
LASRALLVKIKRDLENHVRGLLKTEARNAVEQQVSDLDRKVMKLARRDAQVQRFMTVPGVGPITACVQGNN